MVHWLAQLSNTHWIPIRLEYEPVVSLSKKLYPHCSVLVGFRNTFKCYLNQ